MNYLLTLFTFLLSFSAMADFHQMAPLDILNEPMIAQAVAPVERLDLNKATLEDFCRLPGIGKKKAHAILIYREKRPFTRVSQLLLVDGIGPKTVRRLRPWIKVEK